MLVLTRKSGESILIGGEIRVRVLKACGSRVRLGIEAPDDVRIVREKAEAKEPIPLAHPAEPPSVGATATGRNRLARAAARDLITAER